MHQNRPGRTLIAQAPRAALYRRRAAAYRAAGDLSRALDDERAADERSQ